MANLGELRLGTSLCFTGCIEEKAFKELKAAGIDCIEYSFGYTNYMMKYDYPAHALKYANLARRCGLENWSVHLPFSGRLDISGKNAELRNITLYTNARMIRAAGKAGVKVAVLHPSSEPIPEEERAERMELSRAGIVMLQKECENAGMKLAVENLPRTCLCRTSDEIIKLLDGTGAGVVFDTNHSLTEDNVEYVKAINAAGLKIHSLHISDYYRDANGVLDERHVLPGEGINRWSELLGAIMANGYDGPLMYEVPGKPKNREEKISAEELANNMKQLRSGIIR